MATNNSDKVFAGSVPGIYDTHLVPLIFAPYAADLARRLASRPMTRLLEIASGTGAATRALDSALPASVAIVATDLNPAMLEQARAIGARRTVEWRHADAMQLPFEDAEFDVVACQFGAMFFPDKKKAFAQARRVLRPGGMFVFSVWDRIEENEFADAVTASLVPLFPDDPPRFLARTPHGYHDRASIERDVAGAGFRIPPHIETVTARSRAPSAKIPALAYCHGTPLRNEIEARDASGLDRATDAAAAAIARRFGDGPVDGKIQAHVVSVER